MIDVYDDLHIDARIRLMRGYGAEEMFSALVNIILIMYKESDPADTANTMYDCAVCVLKDTGYWEYVEPIIDGALAIERAEGGE